MTRRALITGADGFVGGVLCRHLAEAGWDVRSAVLRDVRDASTEFQCDITDAGQVDTLIQWAGPVDVVFHLAAVTFVPEASQHPCRAMRANFEGTVNLLDACRTRLPESRFLYVSTSEIYGPPIELPVDEDHPLNPQNPYAISKAAADAYCAYYHGATGYDVVRIRPFNHAGPGQSDQFVLSSFARQIARAEAKKTPPVVRVGTLAARRDFLHVNDVVRAYEQAALKGEAGEAYNVASGRAVPIREALDMLLGMALTKIAVKPEPERLRAVEVAEVAGSSEKFNAVAGWRPEYTLECLLADILNYWRGFEADAAPQSGREGGKRDGPV